jgi:ferredoxin like protein
MTVRNMTPEELLGLDKFEVDEEEAHIVIDYAGCLECGTCRVMCKDKGIVKWEYPRGTFGVSYRYG